MVAVKVTEGRKENSKETFKSLEVEVKGKGKGKGFESERLLLVFVAIFSWEGGIHEPRG